MSNILQAKVRIKGTRPLFWHKFGPDALPLEKQERTGVAGNDPEEWRKTCIVDREGHLYIEPTYVFSALREGAKYTKNNRATLQKPVSATLQVVDNRVYVDRYWPGYPNGKAFDVKMVEPLLEDQDEPLYMDIRGVVNPNTKSRNVRYRVAASPGWECEFTIAWDKTIIQRNQMEAVVIDAGKLVGIGNARAIGMGRFDLVSFEIE